MSSFDTSPLVAQGEHLRTAIDSFAERLSAASRTAIDATNPNLTDTEIGAEWPLTFDLTIARRLAEIAIPPPRSVGRVAVAAAETADRPPLFLQDKIHDNTLEEAYSSEAPRLAFACDVMGWVDNMEQAGWGLLVRMGVGDDSQVALSVYEDTDTARAYFAELTDASYLDEADVAEGAEPYAYLSEHIVVDDPGFAAAVLATEI